MEYWKKISALMSERKVSAYRLSKETGISSGNITDWKNGKANPSYGALVKIAGFFNISVEYLEGKTDDLRLTDQHELDEMEWAAFDGIQLTDDQKRELLRYAKYLESQKDD